MPPIGIGMIVGDNGTAIRNAKVKSAALGVGAAARDARACQCFEKPCVERMFGTIGSVLLAIIHGYVGRRIGHAPGYDPIETGVVRLDELYDFITRYLIDEYPNSRHYGRTMLGAHSLKMAVALNNEYGAINVPPDHDIRVHLGWKVEVTPNDNGVVAFMLPFNSEELQNARKSYKRKVTVYVNPDDIAHATVLFRGQPDPVLADLTLTTMTSLTLQEFLYELRDFRKETPAGTILREQKILAARRDRREKLDEIAQRHRLKRTFMTLEEATRLVETIDRGVNVISNVRKNIPGTTPAGSIAAAVFRSETDADPAPQWASTPIVPPKTGQRGMTNSAKAESAKVEDAERPETIPENTSPEQVKFSVPTERKLSK